DRSRALHQDGRASEARAAGIEPSTCGAERERDSCPTFVQPPRRGEIRLKNQCVILAMANPLSLPSHATIDSGIPRESATQRLGIRYSARYTCIPISNYCGERFQIGDI